MKLTDILSGSYNPQEWAEKGYELPKYDIKAVAADSSTVCCPSCVLMREA